MRESARPATIVSLWQAVSRTGPWNRSPSCDQAGVKLDDSIVGQRGLIRRERLDSRAYMCYVVDLAERSQLVCRVICRLVVKGRTAARLQQDLHVILWLDQHNLDVLVKLTDRGYATTARHATTNHQKLHCRVDGWMGVSNLSKVSNDVATNGMEQK